LRHVALIVEMPAKDTATIIRSLRQDERALHGARCWTQKKPESRRQRLLAAFQG
jgi:hypothetical protein